MPDCSNQHHCYPLIGCLVVTLRLASSIEVGNSFVAEARRTQYHCRPPGANRGHCYTIVASAKRQALCSSTGLTLACLS